MTMSNVATTITGSTSRSLEDRVETLEAVVSNLQKGACHCSSTITMADTLACTPEQLEQTEHLGDSLLDELLLTRRSEGLNEINTLFNAGQIDEIEKLEREYKLLKDEYDERRRLDPQYASFYSYQSQRMHTQLTALSDKITEKRREP